MPPRKLLFAILCMALIISSCKKKYIDIIQVMEKTDDVSIAGMGNYTIFHLFSENEVLVSDGKNAYTTINSGKNWSKLNLPNNTDSIVQLSFQSADMSTGFIVLYNKNLQERTLYTTVNNGNSWKKIDVVDFAFYHDGEFYYLMYKFDGKFEFYHSTNNGNSFSLKKIIQTGFLPGSVSSFFYTNGRVIISTTSGNFYDIFAIEIGTEDIKDFYFQDEAKDVHYRNDDYYFVLTNDDAFHTEGQWSSKTTDFETAYKIGNMDFYGDFGAIVGENSVYTNQKIQTDNEWNDVYDTNGSSFPHKFENIKLFSNNQAFVTAENGIIWKVKFYY